MQPCNKYDNYFDCDEHCGGERAHTTPDVGCRDSTAAENLPACMYAYNDSGRELVNPWDVAVSVSASQVEMLVPSGVAAWPPVRCAVAVQRSKWSPETTNPSLFNDDVEYPAMPMMAQTSPEASAFNEIEYPAMPMMAQEYTTIDSLEYPAMPMMVNSMHGLAESAWTQTTEERRVSGADARLMPHDELEVDFGSDRGTTSSPSSSAPSLSPRLVGLGFRLPDKLALANGKRITLNEFQIALVFQRAAAARSSDSECDESNSLKTSMNDDSFETIEIY